MKFHNIYLPLLENVIEQRTAAVRHQYVVLVYGCNYRSQKILKCLILSQLRSLEVGSEFPSITNLRLVSGELEEDGARLRALDLRFDLAYDGNFKIDVDAVMLLGKIANISITGMGVTFFGLTLV